MNENIKDFCMAFNKKLKLDKEIKDIKLNIYNDCRERINFNLHVTETSPGMMWAFGYTGTKLFTLDSDDLQYLYNKYSEKVLIEMEQNIIEIRNNYKDIIKT